MDSSAFIRCPPVIFDGFYLNHTRIKKIFASGQKWVSKRGVFGGKYSHWWYSSMKIHHRGRHGGKSGANVQ